MTTPDITTDAPAPEPAPAPEQEPAVTAQDSHTPASESASGPASGPASPEGMTASGDPQPPDPAGASMGASGTGAGQSDAPRIVIGAQESNVINANLAGLAAGTVRLAT